MPQFAEGFPLDPEVEAITGHVPLQIGGATAPDNYREASVYDFLAEAIAQRETKPSPLDSVKPASDEEIARIKAIQNANRKESHEHAEG